MVSEALYLSLSMTIESGDFLPGSKIPFSLCLDSFFKPEMVSKLGDPCKQCGHEIMSKKMCMLTLPRALVVVVSRTTLKNWVPTKLDVELSMGKSEHIDLSSYLENRPDAFAGVTPPTDSPDLTKPAIEESVDDEMLETLQAMGFTQDRCRRAILQTQGISVEMAAEWLFEHANDPIENDLPLESSEKQAIDESSIEVLQDAGFSRASAIRALERTEMNIERAFDYLLSHFEEESSASSPVFKEKKQLTETPESTKYHLKAFISHTGASMHCGHYVFWTRQGEEWLLFNDSRVTKFKEPDLSNAYILLFLCDT
jgi:ubiquitin carboxyl-terminal hydrolase 5/13